MDNNNTLKTNMILTDDKEVVIDIEMSKLIYEYVVSVGTEGKCSGNLKFFDPTRIPCTVS